MVQAVKSTAPSSGWVLAGVFTALGAGLVVLVAWITEITICDGQASESCARTNLAELQLWLAVGGLMPAGLTLLAAFRGTRGQLVVGMAITVFVYGSWLVLNDAAVHGWGSDMRLVP